MFKTLQKKLLSASLTMVGVISTLTLSLYNMSVLARSQSQEDIKKIEKYVDKGIYPEVLNLPEGQNLKCRERADKSMYRNLVGAFKPSSPDIKKFVSNLSFDPDCVSEIIRFAAKKTKAPVRGFTSGMVGSVTASCGVDKGRELAMVQVDKETMMVGFVDYGGLGCGVGLPLVAGVGATQGMITGTCEDGIYGYLGDFFSWSAGLVVSSYGGNVRGQEKALMNAATFMPNPGVEYIKLRKAFYETSEEKWKQEARNQLKRLKADPSAPNCESTHSNWKDLKYLGKAMTNYYSSMSSNMFWNFVKKIFRRKPSKKVATKKELKKAEKAPLVSFNGCNSLSTLIGSNTTLVGVNKTYYRPASQFVLVKGPRVKKMIDYIEKINEGKE